MREDWDLILDHLDKEEADAEERWLALDARLCGLNPETVESLWDEKAKVPGCFRTIPLDTPD